MKLSTHIFMAFALISAGLTSCKNDPEELNYTSLEAEYGCDDTRFMPVDISETYTVLHTQADFDSLASGPCNPAIDFSAYDLVIGSKQLAGGNDSIEYHLYRTDEGQELQVTFHQNPALISPIITYHALVPKLGDEETVSVEITVIQ